MLGASHSILKGFATQMTDIKLHPFFSLNERAPTSSLSYPISPSLSPSPTPPPHFPDLSTTSPTLPLDETCIQNLLTLFRSVSRADLVAALLKSGESNWEKAFYGLLKRYRERQAEEFGLGMSFADDDTKSSGSVSRAVVKGDLKERELIRERQQSKKSQILPSANARSAADNGTIVATRPVASPNALKRPPSVIGPRPPVSPSPLPVDLARHRNSNIPLPSPTSSTADKVPLTNSVKQIVGMPTTKSAITNTRVRNENRSTSTTAVRLSTNIKRESSSTKSASLTASPNTSSVSHPSDAKISPSGQLGSPSDSRSPPEPRAPRKRGITNPVHSQTSLPPLERRRTHAPRISLGVPPSPYLGEESKPKGLGLDLGVNLNMLGLRINGEQDRKIEIKEEENLCSSVMLTPKEEETELPPLPEFGDGPKKSAQKDKRASSTITLPLTSIGFGADPSLTLAFKLSPPNLDPQQSQEEQIQLLSPPPSDPRVDVPLPSTPVPTQSEVVVDQSSTLGRQQPDESPLAPPKSLRKSPEKTPALTVEEEDENAWEYIASPPRPPPKANIPQHTKRKSSDVSLKMPGAYGSPPNIGVQRKGRRKSFDNSRVIFCAHITLTSPAAPLDLSRSPVPSPAASHVSTFISTPVSPMPSPMLEPLGMSWFSNIFHVKPAVRF
jgi:hypothetical protein